MTATKNYMGRSDFVENHDLRNNKESEQLEEENLNEGNLSSEDPVEKNLDIKIPQTPSGVST